MARKLRRKCLWHFQPRHIVIVENIAVILNKLDLLAIREVFSYKCYNCGIPGHKRAQCRKKKLQQYNQGQGIANVATKSSKYEQDEDYCFSAVSGNTNSVSWCLDSGPTEHLVNDNKLLTNVKMLPTSIKIEVAKTVQVLEAKECGEMQYCTDENIHPKLAPYASNVHVIFFDRSRMHVS